GILSSSPCFHYGRRKNPADVPRRIAAITERPTYNPGNRSALNIPSTASILSSIFLSSDASFLSSDASNAFNLEWSEVDLPTDFRLINLNPARTPLLLLAMELSNESFNSFIEI